MRNKKSEEEKAAQANEEAVRQAMGDSETKAAGIPELAPTPEQLAEWDRQAKEQAENLGQEADSETAAVQAIQPESPANTEPTETALLERNDENLESLSADTHVKLEDLINNLNEDDFVIGEEHKKAAREAKEAMPETRKKEL